MSQLQTQPWPFLHIHNFLNLEHLRLLIDDWHSIDWDEHKEKKNEYDRSWEEPNWVRDYFSKGSSKPLTQFLSSKKVFKCIQKKFNCDALYENIWVKRLYKKDDPHHGDYSHTDITVNSHSVLQIFFPDKSYDTYGTVLQSYQEQPFDEAIELPLIFNSATIFLNTPNTWHAVRPGDRLRKSYIQRFLYKQGYNPYHEQKLIQMEG